MSIEAFPHFYQAPSFCATRWHCAMRRICRTRELMEPAPPPTAEQIRIRIEQDRARLLADIARFNTKAADAGMLPVALARQEPK